jgi:alpha-N-arabinofuranosidase
MAMLEIRNAGKKALLIGTVSLMPGDNIRGMRADTLALLKQLNASMYRWPGGNFVSGYDWRDGIGPRDKRPPRKNPAWTGVEHNDMGLDEFIDFCREVRAEPVIAVNTGFGDAYSAAQEVEYCNGLVKTQGGAWRARNGHKKPYQVKYWCVGNEMFGPWQLGFMQLGHYVQKHNRFARAMWEVDSTIKLIGVGNLGGRNPEHDPDQKVGWSEGMLQHCAASMNYISEHFYRGRVPWEPNQPEMDVLEHVSLLRHAIHERAEGHRKLQDRLGLVAERKIPIAMDEWNYWHRDYVYGELGCVYDLQDALGVAAGLHEYFCNTDIIRMAHYAQTVNVIGCIKTTKTRAFFATTALPLMLYRQHFGTIPLKVTGDHEAQNLDIASALTEGGKAITIGAMNPNSSSITLNLDIQGLDIKTAGRQWMVAGDDPRQFNDAQNDRIKIQEQGVDIKEGWTLPAYSFGIVRLAIK